MNDVVAPDLFNQLCERYDTLAQKLRADGVGDIFSVCQHIADRFGSDPEDALKKLQDLMVVGPLNEKKQRKVIIRLLELTFGVELGTVTEAATAESGGKKSIKSVKKVTAVASAPVVPLAPQSSEPSRVELAARRLGTNYWIDRLIDAIALKTDEHDFLREAQKAARSGIRDTLLTKRPRRFLVDMPTQSGKTPLYIRLIQLLAETGPMPRLLVIAPYRRLVDQLKEEFEKFGKAYPKDHPLSDIGVWHALEKVLKQVTATTWHSAMNLARDKVIDPKDYDIVFVDEAHLGQTEKRLALLKLFKNAVIGDFTATPAYNDDKSLEKVSVLAFRMTPEEAVEKKVISPWREIILQEDLIDLSDVPLVGDDFDARIIERRISTEARTQGWISFYRDWVDPLSGQAMFGKKGYLNTVSINRAHELSERFNAELGHLLPPGIKVAEAIHSGNALHPMSPSQQKDIFDRYKDGKVKLLVQVRLAGLGLSDREADLCINDAPSLSPVEVEQRGGRVVAIDPNNPDKCAFIVERPDFGRGIKQALMYGEVVGPGAGYKREASLFPLPRNPKKRDQNILSDPKEVEKFVRARMKRRVEAIARANFTSIYPIVIERATEQGYRTTPELWGKVASIHSQLFPEIVQPNEEGFTKLLRGKQNPWDSRDLFKSYTPLAVAVSAALGLHATKLFGTPAELLKRFTPDPINHAKPSLQRLHIYELMRKARNPLTGALGISERDIRGSGVPFGLGTSSELRRRSLGVVFDGRTRAATGLKVFDADSGAASDWATELAVILDRPVEEVFKYDAERVCKPVPIQDRNEICSARPLSLPLDVYVTLKAAKNIKAIDNEEYDRPVALQIEAEIFEEQLRETLRGYLLKLPPKIERILRVSFGFNLFDELPCREIAYSMDRTPARVYQLVGRGLRKLRNVDSRISRDDFLARAIKFSEGEAKRPIEAEQMAIQQHVNSAMRSLKPLSAFAEGIDKQFRKQYRPPQPT